MVKGVFSQIESIRGKLKNDVFRLITDLTEFGVICANFSPTLDTLGQSIMCTELFKHIILERKFDT